ADIDCTSRSRGPLGLTAQAGFAIVRTAISCGGSTARRATDEEHVMSTAVSADSLLAPALGTGSALRLHVDGTWADADDGAVFESLNPSTGEVWATLAEAGPADVDRAVCAARGAVDGPWGRVNAADRARVLWRIAALLDEHHELLAQL